MRLSKKLFLTLLLLAAVFLLSYLIAFLVVLHTPYGYVTGRVYSKPKTSISNDPSVTGGAWQDQFLFPWPAAGSVNVPRDTTIWIVEPRPVSVQNLSLSPKETIIRTDEHVPAGAVITVYPVELLRPNTTYNVSAIVAGTPSWWIFTTSAEPSQLTFRNQLGTYNSWIAFAAAIIVTFIVVLVILLQRKKHTRILNPEL